MFAVGNAAVKETEVGVAMPGAVVVEEAAISVVMAALWAAAKEMGAV